MDEQIDRSAETGQKEQQGTDTSVLTSTPVKRTNSVTVSLNLWWLVGLLLLVIVGMIALWRPWQNAAVGSRKVTVRGASTIKAVPDEYTFNSTWEFKGNDKATELQSATAKSAEVVAELKKLGVADKDIETNAGGWDGYYYYNSEQSIHTYDLGISATVSSRDLAQKVQDYLVTTTPTGQISPQATFSKTLQKKLEQQGRNEAMKDARAKADEMAKNLGFKVGKVVTITDDEAADAIYPMLSQGSALNTTAAQSAELSVQSGQEEVNYTIQVVYSIN